MSRLRRSFSGTTSLSETKAVTPLTPADLPNQMEHVCSPVLVECIVCGTTTWSGRGGASGELPAIRGTSPVNYLPTLSVYRRAYSSRDAAVSRG